MKTMNVLSRIMCQNNAQEKRKYRFIEVLLFMFSIYIYLILLGLNYNRAIADYLNRDLEFKLSEDDIYLTVGCTQAIEIVSSVLCLPGANILLPRPGFSYYEACAAKGGLEVRHFDLLPETGWEVDLDALEALADEKTVAVVIINPGNPCGSVYSHDHLKKVNTNHFSPIILHF